MADNTQVAITELEQDDRIDEMQKYFARALQVESGYHKLATDKKDQVNGVLDQ